MLMELLTTLKNKAMREILFRGLKADGSNDKWIGVTNGNVEIISFSKPTKAGSLYTVKCTCGRKYEITLSNFKRLSGVGCNDCKNNNLKKQKTKHGLTDTRLHIIWQKMLIRCNNQNDKSYKNYGGRGISVCKEWYNFTAFYDWAIKNGYSDFLTIDRVNSDGNYEPNNCRWASMLQQNNNRRNNVRYSYNNEMLTLREICIKYGFDYELAKGRLKRKIDLITALNHPKNITGKKITKI